MKKKIIIGTLLTSFVCGGFLMMNQMPLKEEGLNEGPRDFYNNTATINLRGVNVGSSSSVDVSRTYAQVGVNPNTQNPVLRFATAVTGPIAKATYTRVGTGFSEETKIVAVNTLYAGILADGVNTYYDGTGLTTIVPETINYYWAVYAIEFETDTFVDTDISAFLTVEDEEGKEFVSETKVTSLNDLRVQNNIELSLPQGISVEDYNLAQKEGEVLVLPTASQVKNETGSELLGWYDASTGLVVNEEIVVPEGGITLSPYFDARQNHFMLDPGSEQSDRKAQVRPEGVSFDKSGFANSKKFSSVINGGDGLARLGSILSYSGTIPSGGMFRLNTSVAKSYEIINLEFKHQFEYNFENKGDNPINLTMHQVNSAAVIEDGDEGFNIELQPGESVTKLIEITFVNGSNNKNGLTLFSANEDVENMQLGISVTYGREINPEVVNTVTIEGQGATFANGNSSIELAEGTMIPTPTCLAEGRDVLGYLIDGESSSDVMFMSGQDVTITPVFSTHKDFVDLILGNEQGNKRTPQIKSDSSLTTDKFSIGVNDGIIVKGGSNGYAQYGTLIGYSGEMPVNNVFRYLTKVSDMIGSSDPVITLNTNHTFAYNFENKGETDIHLRLNQVNSSYNIESGNQGYAIELAPGESMSIEFTMQFKLGSDNKNVISMFTVTSAMESGFSMGVTFAVRVGS